MTETLPDTPDSPPARRKQAHLFKKGQSGNPAGRAKGSTFHSLLAKQLYSAEDAKEVAAIVVQRAKKGDMRAASLMMEKLVAPSREPPIEIPDWVEIKSSADLVSAHYKVLTAVGAGDMPVSTAETILRMLEHSHKLLSYDELDRRMTALENQSGAIIMVEDE